jgi:mRNA-degrading endonuclease RelE of RelBE toxin-antitoxin system
MNYKVITSGSFEKEFKKLFKKYHSLKADIVNTDIYLLTIYDKSERDSISRQEIEQLKRQNGLPIGTKPSE